MDGLELTHLERGITDDVLEVSKEFVRENELPDSYVDRIVEFIRFNAYS